MTEEQEDGHNIVEISRIGINTGILQRTKTSLLLFTSAGISILTYSLTTSLIIVKADHILAHCPSNCKANFGLATQSCELLHK